MNRYYVIKPHNFFRAFGFLCAAAVVLLVVGCSNSEKNQVISFNAEFQKANPAVSEKSLHLINPENFNDTVAESGLLSLYIDDKSYGVALYQRSATEKPEAYSAAEPEKKQGKYWLSLPASAGKSYDYSAAAFTIDIFSNGTLHHLNSQDNSVLFGNVSCDVMGDKSKFTGYDIKYVVTVDEQTASKVNKMKIADNLLEKSDFASTDIVFLVNIKYDLLDGNLYITAVWENLSGNESAVVTRLGLLEFFGASADAGSDDFILVPDGCGAVIKTGRGDKSFKPLSFAVYGDADGKDSYSAIFPAYGAKQGDSAFVAIIERGDACATISADRATGKSGLNKVGVSFEIAETAEKVSHGQNVMYLNKMSNVDEVRLCVRLLSGGNASYGGMAAACREQFMRNKHISANTVANEEYMPFNLNIIGASTGSSRLIKSLEAVKSLTTFEQAQDMLSRMKAKGINNINIRYIGALDGGVNQNKTGRLSLLKRLGGKNGFKKLMGYSAAQGHSLFIDINLLTWNGEKLLTYNAADSIFGESARASSGNILSGIIGPKSFNRHLLRFSALEKTVIGLLTDAKEISSDGFCVNDAGSLLYSDYSGGFTDRQTACGIISANISSLSNGRKIMIDTGNLYAIRKADVIAELPLSPAVAEKRGLYEAVPFVQMIIHGTADYSGVPVNLCDDSEKAALRFIEYGACLSYEWCYEDIDNQNDTFFYEEWLNSAAAFYVRANETLGDLRETRMTNNYETEIQGVFCTEYENGAVVCVNYNDEPADYNGVTIRAKSFIKIG